MALIQRAHPTSAHNPNQNSVCQNATKEAQKDQPGQHRPLQQLGATGQQGGKGRHRHRISLGVGQAKHDPVPERLPRRALRCVAAAATAADRPHAQPEQVQAAEHAEHIKGTAANFPRADDGNQCGAAPDHIP
ncbi:hypothetical protein D3C81_1836430 [compost metagenome]